VYVEGTECALEAVDFVRDETLIELRLRFGKLCVDGVTGQPIDGITIPIVKDGEGDVFKGLKEWICGVDDLLCRQVMSLTLENHFKPVVTADGAVGVCSAAGADVRSLPNSNEQSCKVACISKTEVTADETGDKLQALERKEKCVGYAFNKDTKECQTFLIPGDSTTPLQVTTANPSWSCTSVTGAEGDIPDTQANSVVFPRDKRLFDEESPILASNMRAVKKSVTIPAWPNSADCQSTSTWYALQHPMSVSAQDWKELTVILPLVPDQDVAASSMFVGKACVCLTGGYCHTCDPFSASVYILATLFALIASGVAAYLVLRFCSKPPPKQYVKQVILSEEGEVPTEVLVTVGGGIDPYTTHNPLQTQSYIIPPTKMAEPLMVSDKRQADVINIGGTQYARIPGITG